MPKTKVSTNTSPARVNGVPDTVKGGRGAPSPEMGGEPGQNAV